MYAGKIEELEERHTKVHKELLQTLDELYLAQLSNNTTLDKDKKRTIEVRHQLQMSIEKSSVILRALRRLEQQRDLSANDTDSSLTTEGALAQRLGELMDANYKLDHTVSRTLSRQMELSKELRNERKIYDELADELKRVSSQLQAGRLTSDIQQEQESTFFSVPQDEGLQRESDTIEELLVALKVFGGYDYTA